MNAAARSITGSRPFDHITDTLASLHWLRSSERFQYKLVTTVFRSLHGLAPPSLSDDSQCICGGGDLLQLVYCQKIEDVDHLKHVPNSCWDMISQELIDDAIEQWSKPLSSVVRSRGGHIEHRFS